MPITDPLLRPMLAYATAPSWDAAYAILAADPERLVTPDAARRLHQVVITAAFLPGAPSADLERLHAREAFLEAAIADGLAAAWATHQRGTAAPDRLPPTMPRPASDAHAPQLYPPPDDALSLEQLDDLLLTWLNTATFPDKRAMLAEHPELLDPRLDRLLTAVIDQYQGQKEEPFLRASLRWLQVARSAGLEAGWQAFRTAMGMSQEQVSDVPPAIQRIIDELTPLTRLSDMPRRVALLREAVQLAETLAVDANLRAAIDNNLGNAQAQNPLGDRQQNLEEAIACFQRAQEVYTLAAYPELYATTQHNLGATYQVQIAGERRGNLEEAIACYQRALAVRTLAAYPEQYAATQNNMGNTYAERIAGERRGNLEEAIACFQRALEVYTLAAYPELYATTQNNLGNTYKNRIAGERRGNLEEAITCFQRALAVFTLAAYPEQYATTQHNLGNTYRVRIAGERRGNLEEAIACYQRALAVHTLAAYPEDYAMTQHNLGSAYQVRIAGERRQNLEEAIACYQRALAVRTLASYPAQYAETQNNLGNTYAERIAGERRGNLEEAIDCFQRALAVYTLAAYTEQYAATQNNLGNTYAERIAGERRGNLEEAITCYQRALAVRTLADYPEQYAQTQNNLGGAYQVRIAGERRGNLEEAIACFERALAVYTLAAYPIQHRDTLLNLAWCQLDGLARAAREGGDAAAERGALAAAAATFAAARSAQTAIGWLDSDARGHALTQGSSHGAREMYAREAWCRWRLGDPRGAILALEAGRAQALVEAQTLGGVALAGVCPAHQERFITARDGWEAARAGQGDPVAARQALSDARDAIIGHCQPGFLPATPAWAEVAAAAAPDQALVYLAAIDDGGLALVVPPGGAEPWVQDLPNLTWQAVDDWLMARDADRQIVGGYQYALRQQGVGLLEWWVVYQAAGDAATQAARLALPLRQLPDALHPAFVALKAALRTLVAAWEAEARLDAVEHPDQAALLRARLAMTLDEARRSPLFAHELRWHFLQAELERVLAGLGAALAQPLHAALAARGLGGPDQPLALIPCGRLGALPVHAAPTRRDAHGQPVPLLETCELTVQAAARSLGAARAALATMAASGPILALGDPAPAMFTITRPDGKEDTIAADRLHYAEAEADAIDTVAASARPPRAHLALLRKDATRRALTDTLAQYARDHAGAWVQIAGHGHADPANPKQSAMLLAAGETISLVDLQVGKLLAGVRLFNASGCVTAVGDLETAPDELGSFAAGLLQAGAAGAIATLWSVDDLATFALMLRFAQYYLAPPARDGRPVTPARALRAAIAWLRRATRAELEDLRKRARDRIKTIPLSPTGRDLPADRGADLVDADRFAAGLVDRMTAKDALSCLPRIHRAQVDDHLPPCAEAIFWAAFVVYGA